MQRIANIQKALLPCPMPEIPGLSAAASYSVFDQAGGDLYEIDRSNGDQTLLFEGPFTNNSGLAYDPGRNVLWDIDWSGNLIFFDIDNGYERNDVLSGLGAHDGLAFAGAPCLSLDVSQLIGGRSATWDVSGAQPGSEVAVVFGFQPGETMVSGTFGYCATFGIDGVSPNRVICRQVADGSGNISCQRNIPQAAVGRRVLSQAAERGTCPEECTSGLNDQTVR